LFSLVTYSVTKYFQISSLNVGGMFRGKWNSTVASPALGVIRVLQAWSVLLVRWKEGN